MNPLDFLDINYLISIAHITNESLLRFPIGFLKIKINNHWTNFEDIGGILETPGGNKHPIGLRDILFDTGNELPYCILSAHFYENFKELTTLNNSDFDVSISGNAVNISSNYVSKQIFEFNFSDDLEFKSKIGFLTNMAVNWIFSINIGIHCMRQFLSIIFPKSSSELYAFFTNFK